jgi:ribosomal protein S18 acetylase RimI-like enzyme
MLARAFAAYPPMRHFLPSDEMWAQAAPFLFQASLRFGLTCGRSEVTSERLEGAAVWVRGSLCPLSFWRALWVGALGTLLRFGRAGGGRLRPLGDFVDRMHADIMHGEHWVLYALGVEPSEQGEGHGGRLLRSMLYRIDEEGLPCYADTADERNVSLYERFGFRVVLETELPDARLPWWAMIRSPACTGRSTP